MNNAHMVTVALRKLGNPERFKFFKFECVGKDAVLLTGCVTTKVYSKGKRKGRPKYEGPRQVVVVIEAEEQIEFDRFEREQGQCGECMGDGRVFAGWHHETGTSYRPCHRCGSSGKPPVYAQVVVR